MRAVTHRLAPLLIAVVLAGCGGSDSSPSEGGDEPARPEAPSAYVEKMRPIVISVGRVMRRADLNRGGRDFESGLALLDARKQLARLTADPALLLAHDRLARALERGGTLLVADPRSPYVQAAMRAGTPIGPRGAVTIVAPAVGEWAFETSEKLRAASAPVPDWVVREKSSAERLARRAAS